VVIYLKNFLHFRMLWRILGPKPKMLYKFHSVNYNLFDLLSTNSLWACQASKLNDPYDCDFEMTAKYFKATYLDKISFANIGVTKYSEAKEKEFFDILAEVVSPEALQNLQRFYKFNLGVCCFTQEIRSELMWSHYADAGKGVCLGFGFRSNPILENKIVRVNYTNKHVKVVDEIDQFKALFKKRKAWSYEKEWRLLEKPGKILFDPRDLKSITFGPRFDAEKHMASLLTLCRRQYPYLKYYVCKYTDDGLKIEPLD